MTRKFYRRDTRNRIPSTSLTAPHGPRSVIPGWFAVGAQQGAEHQHQTKSTSSCSTFSSCCSCPSSLPTFSSRVVKEQRLDAERIAAPHANGWGLMHQICRSGDRCCRCRCRCRRGRIVMLCVLQVELMERLGGKEQRLGWCWFASISHGLAFVQFPSIRCLRVHVTGSRATAAASTSCSAAAITRAMQRWGWRNRAGTAQTAAAANVTASPWTVPIGVQARATVLHAMMSSAAHARRTYCIAVQLVVAVCAAHHIDLDAIVLQIGVGERAVRLVLWYVFGLEGLQVHGDALCLQLPRLPIDRLGQFLASSGTARRENRRGGKTLNGDSMA